MQDIGRELTSSTLVSMSFTGQEAPTPKARIPRRHRLHVEAEVERFWSNMKGNVSEGTSVNDTDAGIVHRCGHSAQLRA